MTALLARSRPAPSSSPSRQPSQRDDLLAAVTMLVVAACLPLAHVYDGLGWLPEVLTAALLAVGIAWVCRRIGLGPIGAFAASVVGWFGFVAIAFADHTLTGGVVPTLETLHEVITLWDQGIELVRHRSAPVFEEPGLMLLTVTGVWAVAYTVEGMVFRLASPVQAVLMALVLWVTPLAIDPPGGRALLLTVVFLGASAWLLFVSSGADLVRWGTWVDPVGLRGGIGADMRRQLPSDAPRGSAWMAATAAITAGVLLGGLLPGSGRPAWFEVRGFGPRTMTNPIVNIKTRLVSQDPQPVLRVRSPRPVYLRTTALDRYDGQHESWSGRLMQGVVPVDGPLPVEAPLLAERIRVDVTVEDLGPEAVLVPAPYPAVAVSGPASKRFQYDPRVDTLMLAPDTQLRSEDEYTVVTAFPPATGELLNAVDVPRGGPGSALPDGIPPQVRELARQIVEQAGATTAFEQALAIQNELRSWDYSLDPTAGHGSTAMASFLETRQGYCEQFAGTMAVMLRTLDIPARVAVGYTSGTLSEAGEYEIRKANAHAWVEVPFAGYGWIAFEPTPRDDGNVLVPSATNVAPEQTVGQERRSSPLGGPLTPTPGQQPSNPGDLRGPIDEGFTAAPPSSSGRAQLPATLVLLGVLTMAASGLVIAGRLRSRRVQENAPAERVLRACAQVERLGQGLGVRAALSETDREYLGRLAAGHPAAERLAVVAAAAWYAPLVTDAEADVAEWAALDLRNHLLGALPVHRRVLAVVNGGIATAVTTAVRCTEKLGRQRR